MIKPYIYGGIALLIVGLFSYSAYKHQEVEKLTSSLETATDTIASLEEANLDLIKSNERKAGAAQAYISMTTYIDSVTNGALGIIKGYKQRETANEKCLDFAPPALLIERLRENSLQGKDNSRGTQ